MASERLQLEYLGRSTKPLWGGHLSRGEPLPDGDMKRWLNAGWIAVADDKTGYVLTDLGSIAIRELRD